MGRFVPVIGRMVYQGANSRLLVFHDFTNARAFRPVLPGDLAEINLSDTPLPPAPTAAPTLAPVSVLPTEFIAHLSWGYLGGDEATAGFHFEIWIDGSLYDVTTSTTFSTGAIGAGSHVVEVRAVNDGGDGPFSNQENFTTPGPGGAIPFTVDNGFVTVDADNYTADKTQV